jgi:DNA repair exonuclease SbcCD ATPase subunit
METLAEKLVRLEKEFIPLSGNVRREIEEMEQVEKEIKERLEYLRGEIEKECISYGEIVELESLAEHIEKGDSVLLEWANVPETNCVVCGKDVPTTENDHGRSVCDKCWT